MAKTKREADKPIKVKVKMGRPTKYNPENGQVVEDSAESCAPMTDEQIAKLFGVTEATVKTWYSLYPDFLASVKKAKAVSDDKVERSLFERATGYSAPDVQVSQYQGVPVITPIIKHYPPDPVCCIFWLKNRRGAQWRDKHEIKHDGLEGFMEFLSGRSDGANRTDGAGLEGS